ncbi:imine reductase family protein [Streptomyces resistomycificus]|uniref:NADPH-dependent reductive aminase-like C-terminal domain-containing protein n=1 Tax=Streptomyces resistomycificus TaxID=67356 RepID=A0A0L8L437_9ACTN|nr:hypothetical protein [Streptomyces resistomycificus]KOG32831.1 hypothetical protein ADK37_25750 [Streptomyces resistomycificus]KUN90656.1 hypothetical protein AQJ84_39120 [Streptomyces resistomycificus]
MTYSGPPLLMPEASADSRTERPRRGDGHLGGGIMAVPEAIGTADAVLAYSGPRLPGYAHPVDDGIHPAHDGTIDTHLAAMAHVVEESESPRVSTEHRAPRLVQASAERAATAGHRVGGYVAFWLGSCCSPRRRR